VGSLWGVVCVLCKYPICEQLSTGKTLKPKQNRKTSTEKLNHQDLVVLLQCFGPGVLPVGVVLLGGLGGLTGVYLPAGDPYAVGIRSNQ